MAALTIYNNFYEQFRYADNSPSLGWRFRGLLSIQLWFNNIDFKMNAHSHVVSSSPLAMQSPCKETSSELRIKFFLRIISHSPQESILLIKIPLWFFVSLRSMNDVRFCLLWNLQWFIKLFQLNLANGFSTKNNQNFLIICIVNCNY